MRGNTIEYLGRLSVEKGPYLLLGAWELQPPAGFTLPLTDSGPMQDELINRKLENVELCAPVTDAAPIIASSKVVVIPSRTEGAPLVLAEALSLGTPVVVIDVSSGVREIVAGYPRAVLVERESARAIAEGISRALALSPDPDPILPSDSV